MKNILEVASNISTPLALSGLLAAIFFLVLRQIIAKNIFPQLTRGAGADIVKLIIDRLFVLSLVAMILGFVGFVLVRIISPQELGASEISETVDIPEGLTLETAAIMLAEMDNFSATFAPDCSDLVRKREVSGGVIRAKNTSFLIEALGHHVKNGRKVKISVRTDRERGLYEISCPS